MKVWPVPDSYEKQVPGLGKKGCFWEEKGISHHCGVDIYAPLGSKVVAIENGIVVEVGVFTSQDMMDYWQETKYVLVRSHDKIIYKYATLEKSLVRINDRVHCGDTIGLVGSVVPDNEETAELITEDEIFDDVKTSRLHLEIYKAPFSMVHPYMAGYFNGDRKPEYLIDPSLFLSGI